MSLIEENIEELDSSWIDEFDKNDEEYKLFYCDKINFIKLKMIYLNTNFEIDHIKEEKIMLKIPGELRKEELLYLLKNGLTNSMNNETNINKYKLFTIVKYFINIEPISVIQFLKNSSKFNFIETIKNIDTIHFDNSISIFHDLNELIFIFSSINVNKNLSKSTITKKIYKILNTNKITKKKTI
jgi:hypothetical protein